MNSSWMDFVSHVNTTTIKSVATGKINDDFFKSQDAPMTYEFGARNRKYAIQIIAKDNKVKVLTQSTTFKNLPLRKRMVTAVKDFVHRWNTPGMKAFTSCAKQLKQEIYDQLLVSYAESFNKYLEEDATTDPESGKLFKKAFHTFKCLQKRSSKYSKDIPRNIAIHSFCNLKQPDLKEELIKHYKKQRRKYIFKTIGAFISSACDFILTAQYQEAVTKRHEQRRVNPIYTHAMVQGVYNGYNDFWVGMKEGYSYSEKVSMCHDVVKKVKKDQFDLAGKRLNAIHAYSCLLNALAINRDHE
ncbi:hypothetical protein [Endozoicomonas ascidiicola]|uniref:hypothetical protein n=1 Tax=Endozoicomonas ascidiicola TaxID=1698521 RepID=UPI00083409BD|nr:hypothetical protein [Endozoicomonas ascidiicola]